jgi:hypothetical protein
VDGFKTTEDDDCDNDVTAALAQQHGGSCGARSTSKASDRDTRRNFARPPPV